MKTIKFGQFVRYNMTRGKNTGIFIGGSKKNDYAWILISPINQNSWITIAKNIEQKLILVNYSELKTTHKVSYENKKVR